MTNHNRPCFSIIIAVFNGIKTLPDCLNSVWQQSCSDYELIVIDGDSRDGTVAFVEQNRARVDYFISEPDTGVYNAWNKALKQVHGEWVCFLGSDDEFKSPDVLAKAKNEITARVKDEKYVYGAIEIINRAGMTLEKLGQPWSAVKDRFLQIHCVPHPGSFHHRSLFAGAGFDESFRIAADYELLLRYLKNGTALFLDDLVSVRMRVGGLSSRPENSLINLRENRRAQVKNGVAGPLPAGIWFVLYVRVWLRMLLSRVLGDKRAALLLDFGRKLMGKPRYWSCLDE